MRYMMLCGWTHGEAKRCIAFHWPLSGACSVDGFLVLPQLERFLDHQIHPLAVGTFYETSSLGMALFLWRVHQQESHEGLLVLAERIRSRTNVRHRCAAASNRWAPWTGRRNYENAWVSLWPHAACAPRMDSGLTRALEPTQGDNSRCRSDGEV